jgi:hypothetical protein
MLLLERRPLARDALDEVGQAGGFLASSTSGNMSISIEIVASAGRRSSAMDPRIACEPITATAS